MKLFLTIALYGVLAALIATQPRADDIDVYRGTTGRVGPDRVMFALDLRAGVADIVCPDASAASCEATLGEPVHAALDLYGVRRDSAGALVPERGADGVADLAQADPAGLEESMAHAKWAGISVDRYDVLRAALRVTLMEASLMRRGSFAGKRLEVGLMAMHADECDGAGPRYSPDFTLSPVTGCSQGAYILRGFTDISEPANLDQLLVSLAALPDPGRATPWMDAVWSGHPFRIRDIYFELFRYLTGQQVFNGFLGTFDYGSAASGNLYHSASGEVINDVLLTLPDGTGDQPLLAPDIDILQADSFDLSRNAVAAARYSSPIGAGEECSGVAVVNLQFRDSGRSHPDTTAAIAAPSASGGMGIPLAAGVAGDIELVAFLAADGWSESPSSTDALPSIRSYFFALRDSDTNDAMAAAGGTGGSHPMVEIGRLLDGLRAVLNGDSGETATLVSAGFANNPSHRIGIDDDIYVPLFQSRPGPRWPGNVKKLKVVRVTGSREADDEPVDREIIVQAPLSGPPRPAISAADGAILPDALTFWTDPGGADVLAFDAAYGEVPGRDGRSVTRGGAGQQVTGFLVDSVGSANDEPGARQLFSLDPSLPGVLLALDATPATGDALADYLDPEGGMTSEQRLQLIRWIRGMDSFDEDSDGDTGESRHWLMGDLLHSRPLVLSYGARPGSGYSASNPDVRLFFGTNDGLLHMVSNTSASGAESGQETWAFIPPALLAMQSRLALNQITSGEPHPYGMDGEPVAYIDDRDGDGTIESSEGDAVWVFVGQRRGGRGIYAFDMTDPDRPQFKWQIDDRTPGFEQLGLTFSTPRVARLQLGAAGPARVLVFAGGYNGGWSGPDRVGKDAGAGEDVIGNAVYVVNPADGSLIWKAVGPSSAAIPEPDERLHFVPGLVDSIPAPVTLLDSDHDGVEDRAYVGDSGGNVWRIELSRLDSADSRAGEISVHDWSVTKLAALGGSGDEDRRFFHAADVVQSRDTTGDYDGVVLLSGNRAAPGDSSGVDFAFLVKDRLTAGAGGRVGHERPAVVIGSDDLVDVTAVCTPAEADACPSVSSTFGWKLGLQEPGEKGLSTPLVTNGTIVFTSYLPFAEEPGGACDESAGHSRIYGVRLADGAPGLPTHPGGHGYGESDAGDEGEMVRYQSLGPGLRGDVVPYREGVLVPGSVMDNRQLLSVPGRSRWRAYWREEGVDNP